jgi:hypothetical protein
LWRNEIEPKWLEEVKKAKEPADKLKASAKANRQLRQLILVPIGQAADDDRDNPIPWAESSYWAAKRWLLSAKLKEGSTEAWPPREHAEWEKESTATYRAQVQAAEAARAIDPQGAVGPWVNYYSWMTIFAPEMSAAARPELLPEIRERVRRNTKTAYDNAAESMEKVVETDPTNAQLRYRLAEVYYQVAAFASLDTDVAKARSSGKQQAQKAVALDAAETDGRRKLTAEQNEKILHWLATDVRQ